MSKSCNTLFVMTELQGLKGYINQTKVQGVSINTKV